MSRALQRWKHNPFYVLGIDRNASDLEAERAGRLLLGQLELGLVGPRTVHTPFGPLERTPDMVRAALAEVRDARRRAAHALWSSLPAEASSSSDAGGAPAGSPEAEPWAEAMVTIGWRSL
jgi:hypothetical protein